MQLHNVKIQVHQKCLDLVNQKATDIQKAICEVQEASNNETKSSAGDKYETGRAMAQLEKDKLSLQLLEIVKKKEVLYKINSDEQHKVVTLGTLVQTNKGNFYLAVSLGSLKIDHKLYFVISLRSPIGVLLFGKKKTDSILCNEIEYVIESIW